MASPSPTVAPGVIVVAEPATSEHPATRRITIPAGLQLDEPVLFGIDADEELVHVIVRAGEGSRASIIESVAGGSVGTITLSVTVDAAARSDVTYTAVQRVAAGVTYVGTHHSALGNLAHMTWNVALLGGVSATDEVISQHDAPGASSDIAALFFPVARENVQLTTEVRHDVPSTTSTTLVRSIAAGHGRGKYYGNIRILPNAQGSEADLRDDTLLIGKHAKIDAIPALEIAANDVKAFHGATVGAIDEEHIFYMMSRGIERDDAEKLIALGFFEPVLSRFPGETLRDDLRTLLEDKLSGARR